MTKKKYGVRTVNGNEPDPETGNIDVSINGSQDLQSVLDNGSQANGNLSLSDGYYRVSIGNENINITEGLTNNVTNMMSGRFLVAADLFGTIYTSFIDGYGYSHQAENSGASLSINNGLVLKTTNDPAKYFGSIKTDNITTGNLELQFPDKTGIHTLATTDDIPPPAASINAGTANRLTKYNSSGINLVDSNITDNGTTVAINKPTEITSGMADVSGLKFTNLQNSTTPSVTILGTTGTTPLDITIDTAGNVYTCNQTTSNVTKITPAGISSVFAAAGNEPQGMTIDPAGNLYVANRNNGTVTKITPAGTPSIFATTGVYPRGITIDGLGNIYTSNYGSANVTKITPTGVSSVYGTTGTNPVNITIDAIGNIYTCNYNSDNVTKITPDGTSSILGTTGSRPTGIAVDAAGNVYTANYYSNTVTKITPAGVSTVFGTTDIRPTDIVLDTSGNAYVINNGSSSVTKITTAGVSSILATTGTNPQSMVKDAAGTIYICNSGSANVTKIAFPTSKLLTLDANGNVIKNSEDISQSWIKDNKIITNIAVFADNAAAIAGGLSVGTQYRTATGIVMIVY